MKYLFTFIPATNYGSHREPWQRHIQLFYECWRYFVASVLALVADFGTYITGVEWLHLHYLSAASLGFLTGLIVVYILSTRWVFVQRTFDNKIHEFMLFITIGLTGLFINELILFIAIDLFYFDYRISKFLSAGIVFFFNYIFRKVLLFSSYKFVLQGFGRLLAGLKTHAY